VLIPSNGRAANQRVQPQQALDLVRGIGARLKR